MAEQDELETRPELTLAKSFALKDVRTVYDRLQSIKADADFVQRVYSLFQLPIAVNERCGRWYVPPENVSAAVYFKSTDGHTNHCKFSLRRLNFHILPLICEHGGVIIVDSTRRGKRMPDALTKTIPIWCTVINRLNARTFQREWDNAQLELFTPGISVSSVEHDQISSQIDSFVSALSATKLDTALLADLERPLRPIWITPASKLAHNACQFREASFLPLVLTTASRAVPDGIDRQHGYTYVQGAADDEEMWALGLRPATFWQHHKKILQMSPSLCEGAILAGDFQEEQQILVNGATRHRIRATRLFLQDTIMETDCAQHMVVDLSFKAQLASKSSTYKHFPLQDGKKGANLLHDTFRALETCLNQNAAYGKHMILSDDENCKSKASIIALFILVLYYDDNDEAYVDGRRSAINKDLIRDRLVTLVNSRPGLNPSRAALKSLNEYLMSAAYKPHD